MFRSPGEKHYGSDTDIDALRNNLRKRKHDDDALSDFAEDILSKLDNMDTRFQSKLSDINGNISKLTEASTEMKSDIGMIRKEYLEIKTSVHKLTATQEKLQQEVSSLKESMQFSSEEYDKFKVTLQEVSAETKKIDQCERKIELLRRENDDLRNEVNSQHQRERLLNLELVGIPEDKNEIVEDIILHLAKHIGVDLTRENIISANRVSPKVRVQGRPRVIVTKLSSRLLKDNILSASRKRRTLSTDIGIHGDPKTIFVNEHLTPYNKQLLRKVKEAAKHKHYLFIWTKNGRIFVRKGDTFPALQISSEEDLKKII